MAAASDPPPPPETRLPALDGVRGLAILAVMLFHYGGALAKHGKADAALQLALGQGWAGVDVFFVLSGFLITGILLDTKWRADYWPRFLRRRTVRIFPLYYLALAVLFVILPRVLGPLPADHARDTADQAWFWTYATPWLFSMRGGIGFAGHFWSLGVEEQFYLVWPLAVRFLNRRALATLAAATIAACLAVRFSVYGDGSAPLPLRVVAEYRPETPLYGALLALLARAPRGLGAYRRTAAILLPLALATWVGAVAREVLVGRAAANVPLQQFCAALGGAALVLLAAASPAESRLFAPLRGGALGFFGRYSYGLYVVHPFVERWLGPALPDALLRPIGGLGMTGWIVYASVCGAASCAVAWVLWHGWEKRWLALKGD
jgi:peptidoglycan/LPS O-acetylase OafA/YrhL